MFTQSSFIELVTTTLICVALILGSMIFLHTISKKNVDNGELSEW